MDYSDGSESVSQGSGEKTEQATPKRKREERERGNVLKSHDLCSAGQLLACFFVLKSLAPSLGDELQLMMGNTWANPMVTGEALSISTCKTLSMQLILSGLRIIAPLFIFAIAAAILVNVLQSGFLLTSKTLSIKGERINPMSGFKRMFSSRTIVELLKSLAKIAIVIGSVYQEFVADASKLSGLVSYSLPVACGMVFDLVWSLALRCGTVILILAIFDYLYQWWKRNKDMRMTKQEIKDENKLSEGNPETKGRIRQIQRMMATRRMMQDVPKADVVITNPTHFAVALRYNPHHDKAPVVLAKGQDLIAARIKEIARQNGVALVENRPLARSLFAICVIGKQIPADLYQGVAEVLAYVIRLKEGKKK